MLISVRDGVFTVKIHTDMIQNLLNPINMQVPDAFTFLLGIIETYLSNNSHQTQYTGIELLVTWIILLLLLTQS